MSAPKDVIVKRGLGRGSHGPLRFGTRYVWKTSEAWEPMFMHQFPMIFIPVLGSTFVAPDLNDTLVEFKMPRWHTATKPEVLFTGLERLQTLWSYVTDDAKPRWRSKLLKHLLHINDRLSNVFTNDWILKLVWGLPEPMKTITVHGDPTLANLLEDHASHDVAWIDPLHRSYVPNDPHVDLGKLFQSCYGYELVLMGETRPSFNEKLARRLAGRSGLNYETGLRWMYVHLIRLLPYQDSRVQCIYVEVCRKSRYLP